MRCDTHVLKKLVMSTRWDDNTTNKKDIENQKKSEENRREERRETRGARSERREERRGKLVKAAQQETKTAGSPFLCKPGSLWKVIESGERNCDGLGGRKATAKGNRRVTGSRLSFLNVETTEERNK